MMTREQRAGIARLMLRWPEGRAALREKGTLDEILLDLYEGYELACDAAIYWSKSNVPGAAVIAATAAKLAKQPAAFPGIIVTSAETGDGLPALRSTIQGMAAGG